MRAYKKTNAIVCKEKQVISQGNEKNTQRKRNVASYYHTLIQNEIKVRRIKKRMDQKWGTKESRHNT